MICALKIFNLKLKIMVNFGEGAIVSAGWLAFRKGLAICQSYGNLPELTPGD